MIDMRAGSRLCGSRSLDSYSAFGLRYSLTLCDQVPWRRAVALILPPFTLRGLEQNLRNPMLFLFGEDDIKDAAASSPAIVAGIPEFIASLSCGRYLHVFPRTQDASSHCQIGGLTYTHAVIFQWLDHVFSGGPLLAKDLGASVQAVVGLFGKYVGKPATARTQELLRTATLI